MKQKKRAKNRLLNWIKNKYLWLILIPDILIAYVIIKYSKMFLIALLLNNPDLRILNIILGLFILKGIIDLLILIKILKQENDQ